MKFIIYLFSFVSLFSSNNIKFETKHNRKCTGSANCTACSNCSRCGHCNSGGTCGVCNNVPSKQSFYVINYTPKNQKKASSKTCSYNGHQLYVGKRGGCYYYSGNSKVYVDRSYCSGCR